MAGTTWRSLIILCLSLTLVESLSTGHSTRRLRSKEISSSSSSSNNDESLPSLEELENKLDLILKTQSGEKDLLQDFLLNNKDKGIEDVSTIPNLHVSPPKPREQAAIIKGSNGERAITAPAQDEQRSLTGRSSGGSNNSGSSGSSSSSSNSKEDPGIPAEADDPEKLREIEDSDSDSVENKEDSGARGEKDNREVSSIIVRKLEENSKRMETMVVFLADLRNVLSEAVASQEKQVALRGEVVELREEIDYLRKEVQKLRSEQAASYSSLKDPKLDNKIHNDETTIQWLKESVKELRHGIQEVSLSVNVTGLVHLKQHWDTEVNRLDGDLRTFRNDVESLKASQARDEEALLEIKGDIADLRTWQIKMGQKFLQEEQTQVISEGSEAEEKQWPLEKVLGSRRRKRTFLTEDESRMEDNEAANTKVRKGKDTSAETHRARHQRKHKSELISLENVIRDVMRDQTLLHKRLVKLERKFADGSSSGSSSSSGTVSKRSNSIGGGSKAERGSSWNSADYNSNHHQLSNEIDIIDGAEQHQQGVSRSQTKIKRMDQRKRKSYDYDEDGRTNSRNRNSLGNQASNSYRINILENNLKDYSNTLQGLSFKLSSVMDIRESSKQLFTAMEGLETKYDERLTEMQTGLARLEASVSKASITNDELEEQQNLETEMMHKFKKDFLATRDQVHTNHLRLAAVQSQLLKWGLKTCSDLSAESIQNIKIASLEARLENPSKNL